ncbi:capsular biosynthesis protein [Pikeienuella piscinae]|uniref:Capsular biosynthesis protein n=1 Tax=Pikeienuella piscinae TaxID=2748098 RepID=A0A7L5BZ72_9RHOB|nr:capsular biosynthesis protein [Pikeienuella piscinae]QIE55817.1 capsular biosynthesis protein [Pikeienuella piscinae]
MTERKSFLFLQGHHSKFWLQLADALKAEGHAVAKVRLSGQDWLYWPRLGARSYRGPKAGWRPWLDAYLADEGITDVIYYADRHPWNIDALDAAKAAGVRAWTIEFGYLRPNWLTLEPEAMGAFSRFPKDPDVIRRLGAPGPDDPHDDAALYPSGFIAEAMADIGMYASTIAGFGFYPHYRLDLPFSIFTHYYHWIATLLSERRDERAARAVQARCATADSDYTLFAMQLAQDYQIRASSPYGDYAEMIEEVLDSMARAAPATRRLVVKMHPLDSDYLNWRRRVPEMARRRGLGGRVDLIRGGDLGLLIRHAKGAVMANSTVGLHSIRAGTPVKVLGSAVYDMPGLTHQGSLDSFWTAPEPVDHTLEAALVRALAREIQIKGSFFHPEGRKRAVAEAVERLTRRPFPDWAR